MPRDVIFSVSPALWQICFAHCIIYAAYTFGCDDRQVFTEPLLLCCFTSLPICYVCHCKSQPDFQLSV